MKRVWIVCIGLIALGLTLGLALAQGIESRREYARNETIRIPTLGLEMKFPFVTFGQLEEYSLSSGPLVIGPQPGVTIEQVKLGIEAAIGGQYKSRNLKGKVTVRGSILTARYLEPQYNTRWLMIYRRGPQGQGVIASVDSVSPREVERTENALMQIASSVRFVAPQPGKLGTDWKARLDQKHVFINDNTFATNVLRLCNNGTGFFQGNNSFRRLNVIEGIVPGDPDKRQGFRWKLHPVSQKTAFLILEFSPNNIRTVLVGWNGGEDGSTPGINVPGAYYFLRSPEQVVERKLDLPQCP